MAKTFLTELSLSRRRLLRHGATGLLAGASLWVIPAAVWARQSWERLEAARAVVGERTPRTDGIALELPAVSEDGSSVRLHVSVDSAMSGEDRVEAIHLYALRNPSPPIATFRFSPRAGKAAVTTRIRLNESQTVLALAEMSDGSVRMAEQQARVTVSGCLLRDDTYGNGDHQGGLPEPRVRMPRQLSVGEPGEVITLINHPMETGLREDEQGEPIPERIIHRFQAELDGEPVVEAELMRSLAANPYIRFYFQAETAGELRLRWEEDTGASAESRQPVSPG
ncbi:thiosulfate oxidation carrier complex protein SoxZ [Alkalilimnicola ehrlichii MLHE-1]|uniref:Thiosulfate oxidation carrier complex protein SoxZ n=1 Tax=Alkalilimnicola ehrlichii (strain ATCC BAA-1101 / DSM 17681 / MLHE-1) TaxID=187272 RepID=Q0A969_ALKEH|nr:thiosulfate oxidation carrier complex protein SoxZ [Alkalilimnicola ehrlichii]ABI56618.1 conserved hypothetical protein [Alkalilimnicola ehrlichii MLHE-1]